MLFANPLALKTEIADVSLELNVIGQTGAVTGNSKIGNVRTSHHLSSPFLQQAEDAQALGDIDDRGLDRARAPAEFLAGPVVVNDQFGRLRPVRFFEHRTRSWMRSARTEHGKLAGERGADLRGVLLGWVLDRVRVPRAEPEAQPVLWTARNDVQVQVRHRLADHVVDEDHRPSRAEPVLYGPLQPLRGGEELRRLRGPNTHSSRQCALGTSSVCPGNSGRTSRKATRFSVTRIRVAGASPATIAQVRA